MEALFAGSVVVVQTALVYFAYRLNEDFGAIRFRLDAYDTRQDSGERMVANRELRVQNLESRKEVVEA